MKLKFLSLICSFFLLKPKYLSKVGLQFDGWIQPYKSRGESPGLVVMGGDSCSKGHEFESRHCILDGHFFTYIFVVKFAMCV